VRSKRQEVSLNVSTNLFFCFICAYDLLFNFTIYYYLLFLLFVTKRENERKVRFSSESNQILSIISIIKWQFYQMKLLHKIKFNSFASLSAFHYDYEEALPLIMSNNTINRPEKRSKFNEYFVAICGKFK
jgi:hypothetical protein